ncbi:hypothetical protein MNBD_GAMMA08-1455 [hydrothermal vent metagenome]|uniref:TusE/DsrC/DsvC family sulfur relay protein n=1 Tax=hydrothermal vent metagenome TaxID=652676 RepID=A0A3B0XQS7_9ZZZZ
MNSLEIGGNVIAFRADGYLQNMGDWTPELAEKMAVGEGLKLTLEHWDVLNVMRDYYKEYNTSPIFKLLRRELAKQYGKEQASVEALDALFPHGVQQQGSRLAGVPLAHLDAELNQARRTPSVVSVGSVKKVVAGLSEPFDFEGKSIQVYASGNLIHLDDWNEALADVLAQREDIKLTDDHWKIISFIRKFYFKYGITPMVRVLIRHMTEELGKDAANREHMYQLFPGGPAKQGSRIAGLPSPQGCIDG